MQITARHKEQVLCLKGSQWGEWFTQRDCEISVLDDIHNVTGKDPEQPDITSKLPPAKSRWPPLGLFYYFVVSWFRFLTGIFEFQQVSPFSSHSTLNTSCMQKCAPSCACAWFMCARSLDGEGLGCSRGKNLDCDGLSSSTELPAHTLLHFSMAGPICQGYEPLENMSYGAWHSLKSCVWHIGSLDEHGEHY